MRPMVDPALDFLSPSFDARKALYAPDLQPPDPHAQPLDNIYRCRQLLPPDHPEVFRPKAKLNKTQASGFR